MNEDEYSRLLRKASVDDKSKFREVSAERPKTRGRPPKYYHPLLQKEKALSIAVHKILPSAIANAVCIKAGSRLAHLYGLPKTHKKQLSLRPILSATSTYNYALAKWLEDKLNPLSYNRYSILDIFEFQLISISQLVKFKPISMRLANTAGVHLFESVLRVMRVESEMSLFQRQFLDISALPSALSLI